MSFDDKDLRRALDARGGEPSPEYRARLRQSLAGVAPRPALGWAAAVAVILVTLLTAGSVGVLVASRHGRPGPVASGPRIATPTPRPPEPTGGALAISAPSKDAVWVLVDPTNLYRSTDQGAHWQSRPLPPEVGVHPSISFIDANQGWLLAPGSPATQCQEATATIWHTTDGGATWRQLAAKGILAAQCKERIYFATATLGFVTAWDDNHSPGVYSTVDGGTRWLKSTVPDGPLYNTSGSGFVLRAVWIRVFGGTAYLEASGPQKDPTWPPAFIYTSHDGGATWSWKQKIPSPYWFMVTESRWLQLAPDVEESVNGGQAFGPYQSDLHASAPSAVFADASVGYAVDGAVLWRTVNGGSHWVAVSIPGGAPVPSPTASPTSVPLPAEVELSSPSAGVVWALVANSVLYVSNDRGETWQQRTLPNQFTGGGAIDISFVDANDGWLTTCTGATTLWRTTDGARSWSMANWPGDVFTCGQGVSFIDGTHGFIAVNDVNDPPAIYRTADAGASWQKSSLPDPPGFQTSDGFTLSAHRVVRFGTVELIPAYGAQPAGGKAFVFRSTDGGATWSYAADIPSASVDVAFVTATRWLQVIEPDQSEETTDGGKTWHAYATDYSQAAGVAPQVVFGDASIGYATVRGEIKRTQDGGAHWTPIKTPGA